MNASFVLASKIEKHIMKVEDHLVSLWNGGEEKERL
jgi:hypothetical protein